MEAPVEVDQNTVVNGTVAVVTCIYHPRPAFHLLKPRLAANRRSLDAAQEIALKTSVTSKAYLSRDVQNILWHISDLLFNKTQFKL